MFCFTLETDFWINFLNSSIQTKNRTFVIWQKKSKQSPTATVRCGQAYRHKTSLDIKLVTSVKASEIRPPLAPFARQAMFFIALQARWNISLWFKRQENLLRKLAAKQWQPRRGEGGGQGGWAALTYQSQSRRSSCRRWDPSASSRSSPGCTQRGAPPRWAASLCHGCSAGPGRCMPPAPPQGRGHRPAPPLSPPAPQVPRWLCRETLMLLEDTRESRVEGKRR